MSQPVAIGEVLAGKYRIERVLGEGGMGVVVAATHISLEQRVAIKFLLPAALNNSEVVARFAREARAAAKIRGEHVARVIDVGELPGGAPYMVMEYLEGEDLAQALEKRGPLPVEECVDYILQACEALAEAHAAGIVHRDIKPANLFAAHTPDHSIILKVLDFGISKSMDQNSASLTRTSAVLGSAFYLSPEQLTAARHVDARADVWALGVVLYQLLTGHVPFDGESMPEVVAGILRNVPTPPRQLRPDLPEPLAEAIFACLKSEPSARLPNVLELARAIGPFAPRRAATSVEKIARVLGGGPARSFSPLASSFATGGPALSPSGQPAPMPAAHLPSAAPLASSSGHLAVVAATPAPSPHGRTNMHWSSSGQVATENTSRSRVALGVVLGLLVALVSVAVLVGVILHKRQHEASAAAEPSASTSSAAIPSSAPTASAEATAIVPDAGATAAVASAAPSAPPSATPSAEVATTPTHHASSSSTHASTSTSHHPAKPPPSGGRANSAFTNMGIQ